MRMLFQGLIWASFAFILPTVCNIEEYYAISHSALTSNLACERDNRVFEPCGTLERLNDTLHSYQGNSTSIYLLDSEYMISRDIHLNLSSLKFVQIRAWKKNTKSLIICSNHDFTARFFNVDKIIIDSVGFDDCGKSKQRSGNIVVKIARSSFVESSPNSPWVKSNGSELQVTNCIFSKGKANVVYIQSDSDSNATFKNVSFNHSEACSIQHYGISHKANLVVSNCIFDNISNDESVIRVSLINSVAITYSFFSENSVWSILSTNQINEIIISDCYIDSNIVDFNTFHIDICSCELIQSNSLFIISNTIVINNTNKLNLLHVEGSRSSKILNCTFMNNKGGCYMFDNDEILVYQTTFEGNRETVDLRNYQFSKGAAIIHSQLSKFITIQRSVFISNQAIRNGGAPLKLTDSIETRVIDSHFLNNSALKGDGGAMWISGSLYVTSSSFSFNRAISGGALYLNEGVMDFQHAAIHDSQFSQNIATERGGGAVVIRGKIIEFRNCNFQKNTVLSPDGKGGAINVISSASLIVNHTNFTTNAAHYGGALIIENTQRVVVWDCYFKSNRAKSHGGAILVTKKNSEVNLYAHSNFINNSAKHGGAMAFNAVGLFSKLSYSCTNNTSWLENSTKEAVLKFHLYHSNYFSGLNHFNITVITNCSFSNNEANRRNQGRGGAIAAQGNYYVESFPHGLVISKSNVDRLILRHCTFKKNSAAIGGGIYSNNSRLFIRTTDFHQNSAQLYGGGISLELSWMCFEGKINFISNFISEYGKGGAIYSNDKCEVNLCPILWTNKTKLNFAGNSAIHGPILYGGMLDRCEHLLGQSLKSALKMLTSDMHSYVWSSKAITSPAVNFCFKSSCSIRATKVVLYPGRSFNVTVGCLNQLKQPVNSCLIQSRYDSANFLLGSGENKRIIDGYDDLAFQLKSNKLGATLLTISSNISCSDGMREKLVVTVSVESCPLGFPLQNNKCDCDSRVLNSSLRIECSISTVVIILTGSGWLSYKEGLLRINFECPLDYCLKNTKNISPILSDAQCANNHGGVLCGGCLVNYSVVLGSWRCKKCSHTSSYNFIWLTVVMVLIGVVLVMFLLLVKMTVSSGTINGLIFYANIVSFSGLLDHPVCAVHPFLRVFISWINLDLGIEVCFYSGMDVYQKTWLQFVFPFYVWFLVGVIILVCHYSSTVMKLMGMRNIEVLATLFLLSYAKLLKTIVTALSVTNIMVASADNITDPLCPHKVWVYDGNIDYFGPKHLPLFIVAVLFLFMLFMPYTVFLLCGQWLQYMPRKRGFRWIHSIFISTIMDAYHAPYTKHHRYWTGLGLLIRCCLFTIFGTSYSPKINLMSVSIAITLLLGIRIVSTSKLYRNKIVGVLELFYLSNLGVLATVLLVNDTLCAAITVSIALSFTVFVGIFLYHLHMELKRKNVYKLIKNRFSNKISIATETECHTPEIEEKPEQRTTTSYFQLRESLIDSS